MEERKRIASLFAELYNGDAWLGVNFTDTLSNITAEQAVKRISPNTNSIWEILFHLLSYRKNVLERIKGRLVPPPDDNFFHAVEDTSEAAWQKINEELKQTDKDWKQSLNEIADADLEKIYAGNEQTYYYNIHGILQHDAYHLGQIVLIVKALQ